jgi:hypothetical protein
MATDDVIPIKPPTEPSVDPFDDVHDGISHQVAALRSVKIPSRGCDLPDGDRDRLDATRLLQNSARDGRRP